MIKGVVFIINIRPVSELRNNFSDISRLVHETCEPIFLTKNGYGDMVVMSVKSYEKMQFDIFAQTKLLEAESEAKTIETRYSHEQVVGQLRQKIHMKVEK